MSTDGLRRVDLLLILRGLAALSVVFWHVQGYQEQIPAAIDVPGRTAVWLFFGISGYVIAYGFVHGKYAWRPGDLRFFFLNRFLRIYPLFFCLSVLALLTVWGKTGQSPIGLADVPAQFFAVQFNHDYVLSGVFWTLGVELHYYLLAPLLVLPLLAPRRVALAAGLCGYALFVWINWIAVAHHVWSADGRNVVANLSHFMVGMVACRWLADRRVSVPAFVPLGCGVGLLALTNWWYAARPDLYWSLAGVLVVDAAILAFVLAHGRARERLVKPNPLLAAATWLGVLSYGVYAWHGYFPALVPAVINHLYVLTTLSIAAAYASYHLIERRALRLKRYAATSPALSLPSPDAALARSSF